MARTPLGPYYRVLAILSARGLRTRHEHVTAAYAQSLHAQCDLDLQACKGHTVELQWLEHLWGHKN